MAPKQTFFNIWASAVKATKQYSIEISLETIFINIWIACIDDNYLIIIKQRNDLDNFEPCHHPVLAWPRLTVHLYIDEKLVIDVQK